MMHERVLVALGKVLLALVLVMVALQFQGCAGATALKSAAECTIKEVAKKCAPECVRCVCDAAQKCTTEEAVKCLEPK